MQLPVLIVNASLHAALLAALFFAVAMLALRLVRPGGRVRLAHHLPGHLALRSLQRQRSQVRLLLATALVAVLTFVVALFIEPALWMRQASSIQHLALQGLVLVVLVFFVKRLARSFMLARRQRLRCESRISVGVALAGVFKDGSQVFHDVPLEGTADSIDDVLLSPSGVFVVQTHFADRKSPELKLVGDSLVDAAGTLIGNVSASRFLVRRLQQTINQHCSPPVTLRRVLVVPGAQICEQANPDCLLVNETRLSIIRGWTEPSAYLLDEQLASIIERLSVRPKTAAL